jgi:hypothetical protein
VLATVEAVDLPAWLQQEQQEQQRQRQQQQILSAWPKHRQTHAAWLKPEILQPGDDDKGSSSSYAW